MRILKKGKKNFWIGRKLICLECGTTFQLEGEDGKKVKAATSPREIEEGGHYYVDCPICKNACYFN